MEKNTARKEGRLCHGSRGEAFNKPSGQQRPYSGDLKAKEMRKRALWTPERGERSKWREQLVVGRLWGMPCPVCAQESRMASSTEGGQ